MTRTAVLGRDVTHAPGDPRDWRLCLPACDRLEAPGGVRSLTASVLWAAMRQRVPAIVVREAGGAWSTRHPAALLLGRAVRRARASMPGASGRAWRRVLTTRMPVQGRADGPLVMVLPSLVGNGAERQMLALTAGLVARGWPVRVLVKHLHDRPGADALWPDLDRLGVPVEVWTSSPPGACPALAHLERSAAGLPDAVAGDLLGVAGWLAALRPRAVHAWLDATAVTAGAAAAVLGVPRVVVGLRNRAPDMMAHPLASALRPGLGALARHPAVAVTANARAVAEDHRRWAGIAFPLVIPNGVARPAILPCDGDAPPLVLGVFRLVPHKRPLLWLEVAARVRAARPDVRLRLLGDGPMRDAVRAHAHALDLSVETPGHVPDVRPHLAQTSVLLHVSAAEGLPNALLEAQAHGVPVVACAAGGVAEALAGVPVEPPSPEALAAHVLALLDDPEALATARAAARAHAARFGLPTLISHHERLYDTPPRRPDEARRHARAARLRPVGLARSLGTLGRLVLLGETREIGRRLGIASRCPVGVKTPNPGISGATRTGARPPRLACIGETLARDGAPLSLLELARGLTEAGHATSALGIALHDGPLRAAWTAAGWPVRLMDPGRPLTARHLDRLVGRLADALKGADVVLVNGLRAFAGVEAAARAGLPCLWTLREPGPEAVADLSGVLQARVLAAFSLADRVVFVSRATARASADRVPADRVTIIPNAIHRKQVHPQAPRRADLVVLAAGALCPRKAPLDLMDALPLLPDDLQARVRVLWAGRDVDGYAERVRRAIARLPAPLRGRVHLLGERQDMAALWASADVAVCPSHAEAAPRAVLEAQRAGLPLVATAVGGIAEQAAHWPTSWLVPPGDPPALARALAAAARAPRPAPADDIPARFAAMVAAYGNALTSLGEVP
ncbi:glycosyltransferase [Roseospira navarrensis]|nr:glycosyltransferase [Roseospira navarrensis]